ncbi:lysozyme 2-like [Palaemon carinicauda]|uniref:lysozyme 2-like n=1 Tax=Palaemon carinicauda TaxID=392227 RepID=UPI0035B64C1E
MTGLKIISICVLIKMAFIIKGYRTELISDDCMMCLCEAATGCNLTAGCQSTYEGAYFCGPFHISRAYWLDAGSPTLNYVDDPSTEDFKECTQDYYCSTITVENYVSKTVISKGIDCDGDNLINCVDYAIVHKRGGYNCNQTDDRPTRFYKRFYDCWNRQNKTQV